MTACISQMGLKSRAVRSSTSTPGPAAFLGTASRMGGCAMRRPLPASNSTYRSACPSPLDWVWPFTRGGKRIVTTLPSAKTSKFTR